jgi:hypothetical protein
MKKYLLRLPIMLPLAMSLFANSGTTTLTQATLLCTTFGCSNAKLQDGELFSYYIATSAYSGPSHLTIRGQTYYDLTWTCGVSRWPSCGGSQIITANNGQYVVDEAFQLHCSRTGCSTTNLSGRFTLSDNVFSIRPTTFGGSSGYPYYGPGPLTGTGQVELAVKSLTDTIVRLASSDPSITVPDTVMITAGAFVADFTVDAVGIKYGNLPTTGTITAMFPDGHTATLTVTDNPLPPPPDNE